MRWWTGRQDQSATCPITQGARLRLLIREGLASSEAGRVLSMLTEHRRHLFWPDAIDFGAVDLSLVRGHAR